MTSLRSGFSVYYSCAATVLFLAVVPTVVNCKATSLKMTAVHPAFANAGKKDGLQIWRVENFEPVAYPEKDYGKFYSGDSYIVLKTVEDSKKKGIFQWDIHFWLGNKTSQDESGAAAILSVELDDSLGGGPVQHREVEGYESQQFLSYFKSGVRYLPGGVASGFHHVNTNDPGEKKLYQVKGKKNVRVRQVELNIKSMNKGDCFILDTGREIYVYVGPNSKGTEKVKANAAANMIRDQDHSGRAHVTIVDSSSTETEVQKFFSELGSGSASQVPDESKGGDDQEFERKQDTIVTLYKVSDAGGKLVSEKISQKPLNQNMLVTDDCFILDTPAGIYVWIGKKGTTQEKVEALKKAQLFLTENNYPTWTKVSRVVEGAEPAAFREYFSTWQERSPSPSRRTSPENNSTSSRNVRSPLPHCGRYEDIVSGLDVFEPKEVEVYRVVDTELDPLDFDNNFYFFSSDCYVVKYRYPYHNRKDYLLYVWQGADSPLRLRRSASLLARSLDSRLHGRTTQIRVPQGHEPSHLRRLLRGNMIVYSGQRLPKFHGPETFDHNGARLFKVRSACHGDGQAIQVPLLASSLNSEEAYILEMPSLAYLWYGHSASPLERLVGNEISIILSPHKKIIIIEEGKEFPDFWTPLGGRLTYPHSYIHHHTIVVPHRLYHCVLLTGHHSLRLEEYDYFDQHKLFDDDVSIIDSGYNVYVWMGYHASLLEKELALERAQDILDRYAAGRPEEAVVVAVRRGYEPPSLVKLFPTWSISQWPVYDTNPDEEFDDEAIDIKSIKIPDIDIFYDDETDHDKDKPSPISLSPPTQTSHSISSNTEDVEIHEDLESNFDKDTSLPSTKTTSFTDDKSHEINYFTNTFGKISTTGHTYSDKANNYNITDDSIEVDDIDDFSGSSSEKNHKNDKSESKENNFSSLFTHSDGNFDYEDY